MYTVNIQKNTKLNYIYILLSLFVISSSTELHSNENTYEMNRLCAKSDNYRECKKQFNQGNKSPYYNYESYPKAPIRIKVTPYKGY